MAKIWNLLTIALAGALTACGSLTYHSRHQYVLVRSEPSGADIFYQGQKVGTTPAFVEVRRSGHPVPLEIVQRGERHSVELDSSYRWDGSFWPNLATIYLAPIGWGVDFLTGSAWHMEDPQIVHLSRGPVGPPRSMKMAIAPPSAETLDSADAGGLLWQEQLANKYPKMKILSYENTLEEFTSHGYDFDQRPSRKNEYELFARIGADEVFESEFKEQDEGVQLIGHSRNVYTNERGPDQTLTAVPQGAANGQGMPLSERFKNIIHLIPNTIGFELLTESDTEFTTNGATFKSHPGNDNTVIGQLAPYVSSITLTRLNPPRRGAEGKFHFEFVPTVRLSYENIFFPSFDPISQTEFNYLQIAAGLGPEIGWQTGPHYFYLNLVPLWGWHRLSWAQDDAIHTISIGAITVRTEAGYLYFITEHISGRLFVKNTTNPSNMWNSAIQTIAPGAPDVGNSEDVSIGLQFAYTFEPRREIQNWTILH